jgi:hypothetical protein
MGPIVDERLTTLFFRPFQTSTTFANLKATGCGVFHITDDVDLIARAAVGELTELPEMFPARHVAGSVIANACRWYEFEVASLDESKTRAEIHCRVVHEGKLRDFLGLNRAMYAVLEGAILATRLHLIPKKEIRRQFEHLGVIVDKTAGPREQAAFKFLKKYVKRHLPE